MPDEEYSGLLGVGHADFQELKVSEELAWLAGTLGKFVKGGIYLIARQPGIGKSTLGLQLAVDLARAGQPTLYILTEQSREELAQRARLITSDWSADDVKAPLSVIVVQWFSPGKCRWVHSGTGDRPGQPYVVADRLGHSGVDSHQRQVSWWIVPNARRGEHKAMR